MDLQSTKCNSLHFVPKFVRSGVPPKNPNSKMKKYELRSNEITENKKSWCFGKAYR